MLDAPVRRMLAPSLDAVASGLVRAGVAPLALTAGGWLVGVGACVAGATGHWSSALLLWLLNRLLDGLDGPVARQRGASELGGFLDILADFTIYAGFVVAVGIDHPDARVACLALLSAYYASGTAFLALSSILERRGDHADADGRSLLFVGGLAEGTETVIAYVAFCLFPGRAEEVAWIFAAVVAVTVVQRLAQGVVTLRRPAPSSTTQENA